MCYICLMGACNIRNIDAALLHKVKVKCASEGTTLRTCTLALWTAYVDDTVLPVKLPIVHNSHNTKECRVYRCGQCLALGKKF